MRNQYSQPFLNTLLMHLWKQLQPRVFFQCDATSLAHLSVGSFAHSSVQHLSSSLRWNEKHWCSLQRCSLGIQCGFWLGRSLQAVCLKSSSCWEMNRPPHPPPSLRSGAGFQILPGCCWKTSPQPDAIAVLQALAWWWEAPGLLQIWRKSIFVSPDRRTLFLMTRESFWQTWRQVSVYAGLFTQRGNRQDWVVQAHGQETTRFPWTCSWLLMCCRLWRTHFSAESKMALTSGFMLYSTLL